MSLNKGSAVKLFTHNDLDGVGCELLANLAFKNPSVTHTKNPQDASNKVKEFIEEGTYKYYDKVFITDISVNEEVSNMISSLGNEMFKFQLLDHHATALDLNKHLWAKVVVDDIHGKCSGTSMFHTYLTREGFFQREIYRDALTVMVEKIRRYDTWEWKERYYDEEAGKLNDLMWLLGSRQFVQIFHSRLLWSDMFTVIEGSWSGMFQKEDELVLSLDKKKKESYIDRKEKQMFTINFLGRKAGVVFAEQYISELGNALSENNSKDLDYVILVDMGGQKVSLRTVHNNIDLGKDVASKFGGGGHAKASGFSINPSIPKHVVEMILGTGILSKFRRLVDKFSN
jgi:uncharacterized protein